MIQLSLLKADTSAEDCTAMGQILMMGIRMWRFRIHSVHGEVKLRHNRATLCPKYTNNDDVRSLEATEILEAHQGYVATLTCWFLWVSC